jgi:SWI/SNF-related matrix-associated actin-dependent regulator of chromatin subfamily D
MAVVNALWQYIKLNRLQDRDRRKIINCNKELEEIFNRETIEFSKINNLLRQHLRPIDPIEVNYTITKGDQQPKYLEIPVEICSKYRSELEDFIVSNNVSLITGGEITDDSPSFENENLSVTEKSLLKTTPSHLKNLSHAYQFFKEYSENPKLKIQNTILEQKKYLEIMTSKESDLTFDLENEEDHAQFYIENQTWIMPEVELYAHQQKGESNN